MRTEENAIAYATEEDARELARLKQQALDQVHQLEAKYNDGGSQPAAAQSGAPVPWWEGPKPEGKLRGTLRQVDCLGAQARLVVEGADKKLVRLLVADPGKVAISGSGQLSLGCGRQPARQVVVEYFPKNNAKLLTVGEVATIEFQ